MSIETLNALLDVAGFDTYLGKAPDGTSCPYVVLEDITHPNFAADNMSYSKTTSLKITVVESEVHDWSYLADLEGVLDSIPLPYNSEDNQETSEHVCETYYYISFLGGTANG